MKRLLLSGWLGLALLPRLSPAVDAVYRNDGAVTVPPQIDAITFINRGSFNIATIRPFETFDTLYFTNTVGAFPGSGSLIGSPGFWFNHNSTTTGRREMAASFFNDNGAAVAALDPGALELNAPCALARVDPSYLFIWATNITIRGGTPVLSAGTPASLVVGPNGWMELRGTNVDLSHAGLEVLPVWDETFGTAVSVPPTNFTPDIAISDVAWAQASFNNNFPLGSGGLWDGVVASAPGTPGAAPNGTPGFSIFSPVADSYINQGAFLTVFLTNVVYTNITVTDVTNGCDVTFTNAIEVPFSVVIRSNIAKGAVFVGTPANFDTPIISFSPSTVANNLFNNAAVLLSVGISNAATGQLEPAYIRIEDTLAANTNRGLAINAVGCPAGTTSRPVNYLVDRLAGTLAFGGNNGYPQPDFFTSSGNQDTVDPINIIFDAVTNAVVTGGDYAGYEVYSDNIVTRPPAVPNSTITNFPGRIRIFAQDLDLTKARIRAEGEVMIDTPHLVSSASTVIDAENLSFNIGSTNGHLRVQNLAPFQNVARLRGPIVLWSAFWSNSVTIIFTNNYIFTNVGVLSPCASNSLVIATQTVAVLSLVTNTLAVGYHTLMVDASLVVSELPVNVYDLITHSPDVVVDDNMRLIDRLLIDGRSLTINGGITIAGATPPNPVTGLVPPGSNPLMNWTAANAPNLVFFTNYGTLRVPNEAHFGDDRPSKPYASLVNSGVLSGFSVAVDVNYFQNSGSITTQGPLTVRGSVGKLDNGSSISGGDTLFYGRELKFNHYNLTANGGLNFTVTNSLADAGASSANHFEVRNGFNLLVKPLAGDLLGTTLNTVAPPNPSIQIDHVWAGEDRGASAAGYSNNVAIGILALSSQSPDPTFDFAGTGAHNGLYVDVLDLSALGDYTNRIRIHNNLVIYYAAAKLPFTPPNNTNGLPQLPEEFLNGQFGGHLRWVPNFAGPNSGQIVLINGQSVYVNRALFNSHIIDSDNDGLPNYIDADANGPFQGASVTVAISGNGTVSPDVNGQMLIAGLPTTLVATPADGFQFAGWTGSIATNSAQLTFVPADGLHFVANFTFVLAPGTYNGLFYEDLPNGVEVGRSGFITITTSRGGKYSGSVEIGGRRFSFSGQLDKNGADVRAIPNGLILKLQVGNEQATGTIGDGATWIANILADRAVFNSKTNAPFAGRYTVSFPGSGTNNAEIPQGDGYAAVTVSTSGNLKLSGVAGDGTKLTDSATVSKDGLWPLYIPLYKGGGQILGWLTFANTGDQDVGGTVNWIKEPDDTAKLYPDGFNVEINTTGSRYVSTNSPVTGFSNGEVVESGGNLDSSITNRIAIDAKNKVTNLSTNKLTLKPNTSQGLFKGSVVDPVTGKTINIGGAILQKQGFGSGLFVGTNQTGKVIIQP